MTNRHVIYIKTGKDILYYMKRALTTNRKRPTGQYQYHCTALVYPLRLSYFSASVSVAALQRKEKL